MLMVNILTLGCLKELSKVQAAHMEAVIQRPVKTEPVHAVTATTLDRKKPHPKPTTATKSCHWCGGSYPHQGPCPAQGKRCSMCKKMNHFVKVCKSTRGKPTQKTRVAQIRELPSTPDSDDDMDYDDTEGTVHVILTMQPER
ncbi:hypothetical protein NDU88_011734 [Pleurodeles waltl]|uniref:Uncharacterized protein n=1 Tax=Pleurodeles waltl TaxID=8319 RepID=A0AAV7QZG0_PLEWA|nr:hypothetical protein NDU88_011734 [Pleurodeles waltl]